MANLRDHLRVTLGATYSIERELGGGGMSRVFLAEENSLGRRVVVKVLPSDMFSGAALERFKREIALVAGLQHPHIVPLLSAGEVEGVPYFTMPLVEGESLRVRLARSGELPIANAVRLLRDVASALAYAHRKGIVHRDIKPENILLTEEHAVVSDFGVAKALTAATEGGADARGLTSVGMAVGTPAYMSPEQAAGDPSTDHRADIYAFGVVAYEVLTGRPPFEGRPQALIAAHSTETPQPIAVRRPAVPAVLASLVMRCLAKRPADRPQRAEDLMRELDAVPASSGRHDTGASKPRTSRITRPARFILIGGALGLAAAGYAVWSFANRGASAPSAPSAESPLSVASVRPSIAVLPTVNTSGDPANEPFSDGLTDELISALGKVEQIAVVGHASVFALKGTKLGFRAIADSLRVANVLESSVRRSGDRVKITVQLEDAANGRVIWSNAFDRNTNDVFAVQEEIAQAVVQALSVRLGAAQGPLVRRGTANVETYNLFLRGKFYQSRYAASDFRRAIDYFTQAIARDTNYALAYSWRGSTHTLLAVFGYAPATEQLPLARADVEKALTLDERLPDAHVALGEILGLQDRDDVGATREFRRTLELDPRNAHARFFRGMSADSAHNTEAISELRTGMEMDPLSPSLLMALGIRYWRMQRPDSAVRYLREAISINPTWSFPRHLLAHVYLAQQKRSEAIFEFEQAAKKGAASDSAQLAYGYTVANRRSEANAIVRALTKSSASRYLPPANMALAYVGLGNIEEAWRWIERADETHDPMLVSLEVLPAFAEVRADARYRALRRRLHPSP